MPMPDPATFPRHEDKAKSSAKRVVERLTPLCVDWMFHSCLFSGNVDVPQTDEAEREFAKNFEVGGTYFKGRNYKAAESRFREALEYKPDHPEATYKLAVSVDKLGKTDEAQTLYETYLKLSPSGPYADKARKALRKKPATALR
jgi:tetratricopeptide (TPR) repeat protein